MKKFLLKSIFFLIPLLLFFYFMEYNLGKISNSYSFKKYYFEKQLNTIEILILGSSHTVHGINPEYLKHKAFNLSSTSQTIYYDKQLTLKYLDRMPHLKYVIIPISYFSLGARLSDGIERWRGYYYKSVWGIGSPQLEIMDLKSYSKIFLYTPQTAYDYLKAGFKVNLAKGITPNGYFNNGNHPKAFAISDKIGRKRVMLHSQTYKKANLNGNIRDLEQLIEALKQKNITPIFITTPTLPTYYKYTNIDIIQSNYNIIKYITKKYHCRYFNYFTDKRFVLEDFYDNDHLNSEGAKKFTRILEKEIFHS